MTVDPIARELRPLVELLAVVLEEVGEPAVAACVRDEELGDGAATPRLAQALTIVFFLLRVVEALDADAAPPSGGWASQLARLRQLGVPEDAVMAALEEARVEPVLTAHPTEAKRQTVLEHHRALRGLLAQRAAAAAVDRASFDAPLRAALELLWRTGEIFYDKPDVASERRLSLHYLAEVFPPAVEAARRRFDEAWRDAGLPPRPRGRLPAPRVSFGTWVGGDRDGHPLVTAEVTAETLSLLRARALALHRAGLVRAAARLSLSARLQAPGEALVARIGERAAALGEAGARAASRNPDEPWRQLLTLAVAGLDAAVTGAPGALDAAGLADDLGVLAADLRRLGAARVAAAEIDPLRDRVATFGLHLATLDVRQNSAFHDRALAGLLARAGLDGADYPDWDEPRRRALLLAELGSPRPFVGDGGGLDGEAREVVGCYRVLADEVRRHGPDGLGALIVSMTRDLSDLLAPYLFAREAGLWVQTPDGPVCPLPIVPLYETLDDLERSAHVTAAFLDHPLTRRSLRWRRERAGEARDVQQVMVGYSDSNKDGGLWASRVALYRAQEELAAVAAARAVRLRFFHGRGGTISRGAGPIHRFLRALPPGALDGDLRLTEQGEVLSQHYATAGTAARHLEGLMASTVAVTAAHRATPAGPDPVADLLARVARDSRAAYEALVRAPGFVVFFGQATPIDAVEVARLGSRPARRRGERTLADLRAIPWVFAWNQARIGPTGWYGAGAALAALRDDDPEAFELLRRRAHEHPALHHLVSSTATSVQWTDPTIFRRYAELVDDGALRARFVAALLEERARAEELLARIYGGPLAARRPAVAAAVARRAPALVRLHAAQVDLLARWRAARASDDPAAGALEPQVLLTVNAIAAGLGATG